MCLAPETATCNGFKLMMVNLAQNDLSFIQLVEVCSDLYVLNGEVSSSCHVKVWSDGDGDGECVCVAKKFDSIKKYKIEICFWRLASWERGREGFIHVAEK